MKWFLKFQNRPDRVVKGVFVEDQGFCDSVGDVFSRDIEVLVMGEG